MRIDQVQEIQGLYGPFTLTERVVQKIWLRQDFAVDDLNTSSGKSITIKDVGRWNLQEGPDFKEARLVIDGHEVVGDVEIHFNVSDWHNHQHEFDRNFDRVVLHVVLYPERRNPSPAQTSNGHAPEVLFLLPVLSRDLESYVMDEALLELEQQDELEWVARFLEKPFAERVDILQAQAQARWTQKLTYARQRLSEVDWQSACHQYALEVLGYARNRAPMLRIALRYPLYDFQTGNLTIDALFDSEATNWKLNGLRPSNYPRRRLAQYLGIVRKQPDWPSRLADYLKTFPSVDANATTSVFRKTVGLTQRRASLSKFIFSGMIGEKRLNTLIVDAILPLAAAAGTLDGYDYWQHWSPGDAPDALTRFLKHADITNRQHPQSNGWNQGALALFLRRGQTVR